MKLEIYEYINMTEVIDAINTSHDAVKELMEEKFNISEKMVLVGYTETDIIYMDMETVKEVFRDFCKERPLHGGHNWKTFRNIYVENLCDQVINRLGYTSEIIAFKSLSSTMWELYQKLDEPLVFNCCACGKGLNDNKDCYHATAIIDGKVDGHLHFCIYCYKNEFGKPKPISTYLYEESPDET